MDDLERINVLLFMTEDQRGFFFRQTPILKSILASVTVLIWISGLLMKSVILKFTRQVLWTTHQCPDCCWFDCRYLQQHINHNGLSGCGNLGHDTLPALESHSQTWHLRKWLLLGLLLHRALLAQLLQQLWAEHQPVPHHARQGVKLDQKGWREKNNLDFPYSSQLHRFWHQHPYLGDGDGIRENRLQSMPRNNGRISGFTKCPC